MLVGSISRQPLKAPGQSANFGLFAAASSDVLSAGASVPQVWQLLLLLLLLPFKLRHVLALLFQLLLIFPMLLLLLFVLLLPFVLLLLASRGRAPTGGQKLTGLIC